MGQDFNAACLDLLGGDLASLAQALLCQGRPWPCAGFGVHAGQGQVDAQGRARGRVGQFQFRALLAESGGVQGGEVKNGAVFFGRA